MLSIVLAIAALGILYSRTAYLTLLLSFILYLFLSKRAKFLPILLVGVIVLSFTVFTSVKERATHGFESKEYDDICAGRIEGIWKPLFDEYSQSAKKFLIGNGRYAIKVSDSANNGSLISAAGHPHNMYIEQILDAGILGLIVFVLFYFVLLTRAFRNLSKPILPRLREYQYAVIVSLISFLISGLTGRSFFPDAENSFIWIVVGIAIVINRLIEDSGKLVEEAT